jgi:hypothetical protein
LKSLRVKTPKTLVTYKGVQRKDLSRGKTISKNQAETFFRPINYKNIFYITFVDQDRASAKSLFGTIECILIIIPRDAKENLKKNIIKGS